ncbi:MAG TPA: adenylate/guanylate cyclase domain-containing protein [Verrucomicrobiae bacterium]|nr:adenylate/guanylate cyclase domain-containing protein [Verrucomicrobiae bacterium]
MAKSQERSWSWHVDRPAEAMWSVLADTARLNEASKLPRHVIEEIPQPDGSVLFLGRARIGPIALAWREKPVNWVFGQWFEHCRYFTRGPLSLLCARLRVSPEGDGSRVDYAVEAAPANGLGRIMLATGFFAAAQRSYAKMVRDAATFVGGERETPFEFEAPAAGPEVLGRVDRLVSEIEATPHGHGVARRLADLVLKGQEVDLWHIRPLALARQWHTAPVAAIEACLQAVKAGLLEMRWDLLCPRCRVSKSWVGTLDRLPKGAHCPSCNIDYDADFSKNVEAGFRPSQALRKLESGEYCLFGPMSTPHIKLQIQLEPGEARSVPATLTPGPYRLRTLEPGPECAVEYPGGGFPQLIVTSDAVTAGPLGPAGEIALVNRSDRPRVAIIEDRSWLGDCLTADRLTALQAFRDLFSGDVLRPGDEVAVAQVTLMFTDLKGSTALYERIGDAAAYHLVRDHFAFLAAEVRENEGAIVKTIGDAVMAAFAEPAAAVKAALAIQDHVAQFNAQHGGEAGRGDIMIKLGLHKGPCIVVTLNERLDYFGGTVNMAARLQGRSEGGDIVLSAALLAEPEVKALLASYRLSEESAVIKGFARPVPYYRIPAAN